MPETPVTAERDLRAGRFVAALRHGKGLSPEQMGRLCGVGGATIRDIESKGTYPWLTTQDRIASFFGLTKEQIWQEPRKPIARKRSASEKALAAVRAAQDDPAALEAVLGASAGDAFALGVAWAVIRGQSPYALPGQVAQRALATLEEYGNGRPARASA